MSDVATSSDPNELDVFQILKQAVGIAAEDIRFTAYRPADEVGIRFKLPSRDGSPKFISSRIETYRGGTNLVKALFQSLCGVKGEIDLEGTSPLSAELEPQFAEKLGIHGAHVLNGTIRSGTEVGFITVLTLNYVAQPSVMVQHG